MSTPKHPFRQHPAKSRSFCQDCMQTAQYEGHPGGTEPMKPRAGATLSVTTPGAPPTAAAPAKGPGRTSNRGRKRV